MPDSSQGPPKAELNGGANSKNRVSRGNKNWYEFFLDIKVKVPEGQPPIWQTPMFFALIFGIVLVISKVLSEIFKNGP